MLCVWLQGLPGCLPWGAMQTYLNDYLSQDKGLGVQQATAVLLAFGVGGAVGVVAGGSAGQWLYNRWVLQPELMQVCLDWVLPVSRPYA